MPVITLHVPEIYPADRLQHFTDTLTGRLASILQVATGLLWIQVFMPTFVQEGMHAEMQATHCTVSVLANPRPDDTVNQAMNVIAQEIVSHLGLGLNRVWIHWIDLPTGRTFADGQVVLLR